MEYMSPREFARREKMPYTSILNMINAGKIPIIPHGKRVLLDYDMTKEAIKEYMWEAANQRAEEVEYINGLAKTKTRRIVTYRSSDKYKGMSAKEILKMWEEERINGEKKMREDSEKKRAAGGRSLERA